jgi:hypothetical protein
MLAAAMAGWKPPVKPMSSGPTKQSSEEDIREMIAAVNGAQRDG